MATRLCVWGCTWLTIVLHLLPAAANYCEFGLCNDTNQYCCGKNKCCSVGSNMWFFWAGILVVVFVLVIVAICNRKSQTAQRAHKGYDKLSTQDDAHHDDADSVEERA